MSPLATRPRRAIAAMSLGAMAVLAWVMPRRRRIRVALEATA